MNGFFSLFVTLFITGVVSGMEAKRGEKVVIHKKYGLENLRRVILYEASIDCHKLKREIFKYCSPKEEKSGCANNNSGSTFSIDMGTDSISFTPLNASDGCYVASYIFGNNSEEKLLIVVHGQLPYSPDPPLQENPAANSTKGTEDLSGITVGIAVSIAMVLITVGIAVCILAWCCLKKKKVECSASDCKKYLKNCFCIEGNIKGDSLEMMDRIPHSEDEDNHSLMEVRIHDPLVGQENGTPGQNLQNNNSDDNYNNSKHNNKNYYCDGNLCKDDAEIKNNYVNNNNDSVADGKNGGGGGDDVISSGDNFSNGRNDYYNKF